MEQTAPQLIRSLQKQGMNFKSFQLSHRGRYSVGDADWNYKDVPHLAIIHKLVDATLASVTEKQVASINLQKILGFRFPVTVFNYQPKSTVQTYFTTLFFYVLIIETKPVRIAENETDVTTTYNIGATGIWLIFFPVLRWLLKRNYEDLMSGDIPMRERRGQLRDWGYKLRHDTEECGFESTVNISKTNVWSTHENPVTPSRFEVSHEELKKNGQILVGRDDHLGLRINVVEDKVCVFPRLCPHEGASLDSSPCDRNVLRCPWHGRAFGPLAKFGFEENFTTELPTGKLMSHSGKLIYEVGEKKSVAAQDSNGSPSKGNP